MTSDVILIQRYLHTRDAEAFVELTRRYANMVYSACLRVTRNREDAEDIAQECFLELAMHAGTITTSLPGWLHTLAHRKAVDRVRRETTRHRYEEEAMRDAPDTDTPAWDEIAPLVDAALGALPEEVRAPVLLHYLGGRTQQQVARELGINQSTVSRRLERGVALLREHLREAGILVSVAVLATLLTEQASVAAPATLLASLGKLALTGISSAGGVAGTATPFVATIVGKAVMTLSAIAVITAGIILCRQHEKQPVAAPRKITAITTALTQPAHRVSLMPSKAITPAIKNVIRRAVPLPSKQEEFLMSDNISADTPAPAQKPIQSVAHPVVLLTRIIALAEKLGASTEKAYQQTRGVIAARAICLQAAGCRDADYESVMTVSGWGSSFTYHPQKFFLVYFGPLDPGTQDTLLANTFGRQWVWTPRGDTPEDTWQLLCKLLDAGTPVEGEHLNEVLFVGYQDAEKAEERKICVCVPFAWKTEWWTWQQFTEWWDTFHGHSHLQYVGDKTPAAPAVETATTVIDNIVTFARNDGRAQVDFMKEGKYGLAGIEAMANDVANPKLTADDFDAAWFGCHAILPQIAGRQCTAQYLRQHAGLFSLAAAAHLRAAAAEYEMAYADWGEFLRQLGYRGVDPSVDELKARWKLTENRKAGAAAIRAALAHEQAAITALEQALAPPLTAKVRRDDGNIMIDGVPHGAQGNSYAQGLNTILNFAGTPVDYDTIMGDTGQAFILQAEDDGPIVDGSVDVGWWPLAAWGIKMRLAFLGQAVGREIRTIAADETRFRADPAADYRVSFATEVDHSLAAGKALLAQHDLCFVVTGRDQGNPPLLGSWGCDEKGETKRIASYPWGLIVLGEPIARMDRREADMAALRYAVALGHDEVRENCTGQKSFALWAAVLRDMQHRGQARYHANMILHLGINRRSAITYLRAMAQRQPRQTADHLRAAAAIYEQVLAELQKADTSEQALNANEGRETLAKLVESMAAIEARAIAEIEQALAPPSTVHREGGKVWVEGVENLAGWGRGQECTFIGSLAIAMRAMGEQVDYDYLMGISGQAFRLQIRQPAWDASAPDAGCGFNTMISAMKALGYTYRGITADPKNDLPENRKDIMESIQQGKPVVAMDLDDEMDWGVIAGYAQDGRQLLCRTYASRGDDYTPHRKWPWMVWVIEHKEKDVDRKAVLLQSLKRVVELANTKQYEDYASGYAAFNSWISALEDDARFDKRTAQQVNDMVHPNAWCYDNLYDARASASRYLRAIAQEFTPEVAGHLTNAADIYAQAVTVLQAGQKDAPFTSQLRGGTWTKAMRHAEAGTLKNVLSLEKAAVAEIEAALAPNNPGKKILTDVPGFHYIQDGFDPFALGLQSCLTYLKSPRPYSALVADSGACFRMAWNHTEWDEGNMGLGHLGAEPFRRGVQCAGYRPRFLVKPDWWKGLQADDIEQVPDDADGKRRMREAVKASIDNGVPVLAFGVVGPPEVSVITGYDDGGEVLIGWSCFQDDLPKDQREANGMFRQRAWWEKTHGLILLDGKLDEAAVKRARGETLAWAYRVMTLPKNETHEFGEPAYKDWGYGMVKDYEFPEGDEKTLASRRNTFWDGMIMQAERGNAAAMLEREAKQQPLDAADHLRQAARHLREEYQLCGRAQTVIGGEMLPSAGLADPVKRRAAVDIILQCRDHYVQATKHLALALGKQPPGVIRDAVELDGLRPAFRTMTLLGTVLGCMRYPKKDVDPAWLYGISGAAFMLNIDRQVDVSGPTSWNEREHFAKMLPYLGFTIDNTVAARVTDADFVAKQQAARAFITAKVDAGIPCVGWDGGFPEYVTINGYTPKAVIEWTHYVDGGYRVMPWEKFGRNDTDNFNVFSVEPVTPPGDEREAILKALQFALSQRATDKPLDMNHADGMQGYDLWLKCLETGEWRNNPFWGVHHNVACWGECRAYAEAFLRLAGQKLGGKFQPLCEEAADQYKIVRTSIEQMQAVFLYRYPQPPVTAEGEAKATALLRTARNAELRGLAVIERIVAMLDGSK